MSDALVDIVVLVHDKSEWADLCVRSVEAFTKNSFRLIIVDSGSREEKTREWLEAQKHKGHTVLHKENTSFSSGVNMGVQAGNAKFIIVLNDDAIVTEGWDTALLTDASDKYTGLVSASYPGAPAFAGEVLFSVFVCVCLRREVWNAVGPMDAETFDGFSSEDLDYSWRVRKAGYKLKASTGFVMHAGSRTLSSTVGDEVERQRNNLKYNQRLFDKWGKEFAFANSKPQKRGVVVTYHAEEWTRVEFMKNLMGLRRSDGVGFEYLQIARAPIHHARQIAMDWAVDSGMDWVVQLDDDATFPNDLLRRLLSHNREVVTAIAYQRKPPHLTCVFELGPDGLLGAPMEGIEHTGLRKADVSGFHCSIVHTSVIKKMREAGIKQYFGGFENRVGEDFAFCLNMKKLGIPLHVDTELISGHIGSAIVVDEAYKREFTARGGR